MIRRVLRNLATVGVGVSLVLCLVIVVIWVRSYWKREGWVRTSYLGSRNELRGYEVQSAHGGARLRVGVVEFKPGVARDVKQDGEEGRVVVAGGINMGYSDR